jgi:hypothetical protein
MTAAKIAETSRLIASSFLPDCLDPGLVPVGRLALPLPGEQLGLTPLRRGEEQ